MIATATPEIVVVDYLVGGPRSPQAVLKGESRLMQMLIACEGRDVVAYNCDFAEVLRALGPATRVYPDALFALAVEGWEQFPAAPHFHDWDTMWSLVTGGPRSYCQDKTRTDPETSQHSAIARVQHVAGSYANLLSQVNTSRLKGAYAQIERAIIEPALTMIANGLLVDTAGLEELHASCSREIEAILGRVATLLGHSVNLRTDAAIAGLLYEELRLPVAVRTHRGKPAVTLQALQQIASLHPVVPEVIRYKQLAPLDLFALQLRRNVVAGTNRLQPGLNPLGSSTGRFSCSGPNLMSVPNGLLHLFVADPGYVLLEADFSQIELRVLAHVTQDPFLLQTFANELDPHIRTAAAVLGIPEDQVSAMQREQFGKAVNFGIAYGQTAAGLAQTLNLPLDQATSHIERFFLQHPKVREWIESTRTYAMLHLRVNTPFGRVRYLPNADAEYAHVQEAALRKAVNTVIQGGAAELNKLAIIRMHKALPTGCQMLFTVHDSVLLQVPADRVAETVPLVKAIMEQPPDDFTVPLRVKVGVGRTWAECKDPHNVGDERQTDQFQGLEAVS